jgi:hypothetical protein
LPGAIDAHTARTMSDWITVNLRDALCALTEFIAAADRDVDNARVCENEVDEMVPRLMDLQDDLRRRADDARAKRSHAAKVLEEHLARNRGAHLRFQMR